eukprot:1008908-Pleurochrysis_carterae.AAC.3
MPASHHYQPYQMPAVRQVVTQYEQSQRPCGCTCTHIAVRVDLRASHVLHAVTHLSSREEQSLIIARETEFGLQCLSPFACQDAKARFYLGSFACFMFAARPAKVKSKPSP